MPKIPELALNFTHSSPLGSWQQKCLAKGWSLGGGQASDKHSSISQDLKLKTYLTQAHADERGGTGSATDP